MPKQNAKDGKRNLIGPRLRELRIQYGLSQRGLARELQLRGYDMEKGVITRIENDQRFVTDIELKALVEVFGIDYDFLIDGKINDERKGW